MKRKLVSLLLVLSMLLGLTIPAYAAAADNLSAKEPTKPSGFTHYLSANRNTTVEATLVGASLTLVGYITGMGTFTTIIGIPIAVAELFDDDSLPAKYVDYIYEADNPEVDYGVPYVYWHKLKYTFEVPDGGTYIRWGSYYEYAVAPR